MAKKVTIVGLTGGIGSGKSTVLSIFNKLGFSAFVADEVARDLMETDPELITGVKELLGEESYKGNTLQRQYVASIVFNEPQKLKTLNNLVHPVVRSRFESILAHCKTDFLLYEAAILFESGGADLCDFIITVVAPLELRIERIMKRDGLTRKMVMDRMNNQLNDFEKLKHSDFVIRNHTIASTAQQIKTIFDLLQESLH
jgi:dephospho-CoA kinase